MWKYIIFVKVSVHENGHVLHNHAYYFGEITVTEKVSTIST